MVTLALALFVALTIAAAAWDWRTGLMPYTMTFPLFVVAVLLALWWPGPVWWHGWAAMGGTFALLVPLYLVQPRSPIIGDADVMMIGAFGLVLGVNVLAMIGVAAAGPALLRLRGARRVRWGPYLAVAGLAVLAVSRWPLQAP